MKFMPRNLETSTEIESREFARTVMGSAMYVQHVEFRASCDLMDYESAVAWCAILTAIATAEDPKLVSIDEVKAHVAKIIEEAGAPV